MVRGQRKVLKPPHIADKHNSLSWWSLLSWNNFPFDRIKSGLFDPTDNEVFNKVAQIHWIIEIAICLFIIKVRAYTEIDWSTYMQQTELFLHGERNYSRIEGDTGPVVYPAGHLWIYSLFYYVTNEGQNILKGQICFLYVYILNQITIYLIYGNSSRIPPYVITLITFLSYRLHSIYVLRMFNDTLAMLFCNIALVFMVKDTKKNYILPYVATLFFSLGVGVKMNILLFAPAIAMIVLLRYGPWIVVNCGLIAGFVQICLGFPFLIKYPKDYIFNAFNFGRVFLYKWTVNWKCISEELFLDKKFHLILLSLHILFLIIFAIFLTRKFFDKNGKKNSDVLFDPHQMLKMIFTFNLIGMTFSRSLHYQFYSWYYHSVVYLVFSERTSLELKNNTSHYIGTFIRVAFMVLLECCWYIYPSTPRTSALLHVLHGSLLISLFFGTERQKQD